MLADHGQISADDPDELVARVVRERKALTAEGSDATKSFAGQHIEWRGLVALPLVASDEAGGEDAEGVLLASFADELPDLAGPENILTALADLSAVAIRQARLENALLERADWIGRLANTDPLTGLANRVTFERMLELEIARATRQESQVSVLLFDVDDFAGINERARRPGRGRCAPPRSRDARGPGTAGRHRRAIWSRRVRLIAPGGGGEVVGRRVRDALTRLEAAGQAVSLGVGGVVYPRDGGTTDELLAAAATALAEAKRRGRGSIVASSSP